MPNRTRLSVLLLISTLPVMTGAVLSPALPDLRAAFGGGQRVVAWTRWVLTTPALFTVVGAPLAGGGMGLFVPSLSDGVGTAAPQKLRGRLMGGLSTLRNLGRFASPLLAVPAVVGTGAAAPFVGGALISGGLALGFLTWTAACRFPGALQELVSAGGASQGDSQVGKRQSKPEPAFCQT